MKYGDLIDVLGKQGFFDLASVDLLSGEKRESIRVQLSRWCKSGKLIPLRRGMYAFPAKGTAATINPALLANRLYAPSYISTYWALGFYGLIPEKVVTYTSMTQRVTRSFPNPLGEFQYRTIKKAAFFGYRIQEISGDPVLIAAPEKALLDLWHLENGSWDEARMAGMRFQEKRNINAEVLRDYAKRYDSPRLCKAVELWLSMNDEEEGATEL